MNVEEKVEKKNEKENLKKGKKNIHTKKKGEEPSLLVSGYASSNAR